MGLMDQLPMPADPGRLIVTPHPVLLDGQRNVAADLRPGESLYAFLQRHVDGLDGQAWAVSIGGREVPRHLWHCVYPKHGQVIEVRGTVGKSALSLVALVALTYFTFGFGTATAGMWGAGAVSSAWGGLAATGVYMAGSMLINKVLAPKLGSATSTAESVYSLSSAQNRARPYEPLGLLFGAIRITPDLASAPYTWFEGDDQYLGMTLTPGLNVDRIDALYNGDTLLSSYEGVTVWHSGYSGMPEQTIPLYSNADTAQGGTLIDTSTDPKHTAGAWIERTSSADTIRLQVNIEFVLYDTTSKGKPKTNSEIFNLQYRPTGTSTWLTWGDFYVSNSTQKTRRVTYGLDVALGQYDVRVRVQGRNTDGKGANCNATWNTLTSIQQDTASYAGIPRTGIKIKATGQLNGALQEVRGKAYAKPMQLWDGSAWKTVTEPGAGGISNPGAQILYYARGIRDDDGKLIGGMGLDDDMIDIDALKGFMLYCADNGHTYDYWITDARSHSDVLDKIALTGMGEITWAGGKLSVVWAGADQPLSGVVNMATIKKGSFQVDYALANAADGIEYSYTDPDTLETQTLRVAAPGVATMLNPAQVAGEGITSEQHAARMARWHLAQSLYQYKSISYDTDLEHLSYRRLSVLALQHDLTQWGYGGRVRAAVNAGGTVTLTLDEPVPAPSTGNAYIGLRIPGEAVYRVFAIQPFTGETASITLADAWPSDAAVPGDSDGNPAWDTIWIYDFKQTPGYRVRVTGIEPESDLKGASISVVPEGPEFWTYVLTGAYTPAPNQSMLPTRPVASNLRVTERNVIQGDTVYTELQVTFDISGRAVNTVVSCDVDGDGQLDEVAQTVTRSASFRIPGAGSYTILVRPYDEDGNAGVPGTIIYVTASADQPPVLVDSFSVDELDGGVRRYSWGFNEDTIQSANFAGVEIRYVSGTATAPDWANMIELGGDGFHSAAFESTLPSAGTWTFAIRSRNTNGTLSTNYLLLTKTLAASIGENVEHSVAEIVAQQQAIDNEIQRAIAAELQLATDFTSQLDIVNATLSDLLNTPAYDANTSYAAGALVSYEGKLYRAERNMEAPAPVPSDDGTNWALIGNYSSLVDAVQALSIQIEDVRTSVSDIDGEVSALTTRTDGIYSILYPPMAGSDSDHAGEGTSFAGVWSVQSASTANDIALAQRTDMVAAQVDNNTALISSVQKAQVEGDAALASRLDTVAVEVGNNKVSIADLTEASVDIDGRLRAVNTVALNVNGYVSGTVSENNGVTASFSVMADIFRVVSGAEATGMEWQANYLRTYGTGFQFIIGTGFGVGGQFAMWFGPNVGAAACDTSNAISYSTIAGYQQTSGVIKGSLLSASAMELGSTRIHTGGGRLAPFIVRDSICVNGGMSYTSRSVTIDGFIPPDSGSGYSWKRFAEFKKDVFIEVIGSFDAPTDGLQESIYLEVSYDNGSTWTTIVSTAVSASYKAATPVYVRYTTLDSWTTCAFRARTTQGHTLALAMKVEVMNFNPSGANPGSNSGMTGAATPEPPSNGGGEHYCVDYETTVLPDGRYVRDLRVGDLVEAVDVRTGLTEWVPLRAMGIGYEDCYYVRTSHGEVIQSESTPMDMRDGSVARTPELGGKELLQRDAGWEVAQIEFLGMRKVCKPDFGNRMFFAGTRPDATIATHNIQYKPAIQVN